MSEKTAKKGYSEPNQPKLVLHANGVPDLLRKAVARRLQRVFEDHNPQKIKMEEEIELGPSGSVLPQDTPSAHPQSNRFTDNVNPYLAHRADDDETASVQSDVSRDGILPLPDEHGKPAHYPGDDERQNRDRDTEPKDLDGDAKKVPRSIVTSGIEGLKYIYSMALLIFSLIIVNAAIFNEQTTATDERNIHPALAFICFWFLICWLAMMEGGQIALVGLQPLDKALYADTHARATKCTNLAHRGDNMERFIVGRQFLFVLAVFAANFMASVIEDASVMGLSEGTIDVFLTSGFSIILITVMIGQLTAQVNAANCMLDFTNNYFMLFTTYVSLGVEFSGILHSAYLVQIIFSKITRKPIASNEPRRNALQNLFFWGRVLMSLAILGFAFAVTLSALFEGQTTMWSGVPDPVSVILFFVLMCFVGILEGIQIALFTVVNMPEEDIADASIAKRNCELAFGGQNLQAFLIGRQICVTACMFVVARISTLDVDFDDGDEPIFGVSDGVQEFFNTGLLGAVITTIVASLAWRVIGSSFPLAFLSNRLVYFIIRLCLLVEASGICSASWVLGRFNKLIVGFQPDEVYLDGAEPHTMAPVTRRDKDIDRTLTVVRFLYSLALLVFSVVVVMAAIFSEETVGTKDKGIHPAIVFFIFWFLICWLGMMEGGQGALVGLQPIDKDAYAESHPKALLCTTLAHKGDNMERVIIGRQFLVVLVVFVANLMASAAEDAEVLNFPDLLNEIFLSTGLALILTTVMIGQLTAQVNAANCMLDFINNYFMLFTTYVSLAIEFSGLLHSVYIVQIIFSRVTGKPIESNEPPRTTARSTFFWARVVMSLIILGLSFVVTLTALFQGNTTMWDFVPDGVSVVVFLVLMCVVGVMEGMQIALFAVVNMPEEELQHHSVAYANCQLAFSGQNLQAFLIGRQICVTICMFVVARITTIDVDLDDGEDPIFGVSDGLQEFFNTGLLGAVITTIVASLAWRIVASTFPIAFLSNPVIYLIIRICLTVEASGLCSAAWVLGRWNKLLVKYQPDEVYLEDAEPHGKEPVTKRDKDIETTVWVIKFGYSMGLLVFSIMVVMSAIFSEQTEVAENAHPAVAFFVFWIMIIWLGLIEGGQGCLVGLQPVDPELYAESHPVTYKCTHVAHKGDNMERFLVGRQFLVVLVVFVTNLAGAAVDDASVLDLSDTMNEIFLASGVAMILVTIMIGQLTAQINAARCMLDFINTNFMLFTTYVSLAIEFSGLLHSAYLFQMLFSKITRKPIESNEPPRDAVQQSFFMARVFLSLVVLGLAFSVTLAAIFQGSTTMWDGVPSGVSVFLFFVLMCIIGMMEGMQIALFAVVKLPEQDIAHAAVAKKNCELAFCGRNFQSFLVGRQICVTACLFLVARITKVDVDVDDGDEPIFGVSDGFQEFFNTGLLGALITTIVGSLAWRVIASSFPLTFLSNPLIYLIIRLCLLLEASGVCSAAWLFAIFNKQIFRSRQDEVHIGTPEERVAAEKEQEQDVESLVLQEEEVAT